MSSVQCRLGLAVFAAGLLFGQASAQAGSAEKGKTLFVSHGCFQCHGTVGQGGNAGPKLAPDPMPYEALSNFIRTSSRQMPPYREEILTNPDLEDIYAYLQSVPAVPDYKTIPLLKD